MAVALPALVAAAVVVTGYDGVTWLRGDCPYYYVTSVSLLEDHDLDLWNQLGGAVSIHDRQVALDRRDRLVPKHPPWMPAVAVPWVAAGREAGALVFNLTQYLLLLALLWCLARRVAPPRAASMAAAATGCLSFLPHYVWNFSPDVFITVLIAAAVCLLTRIDGRRGAVWDMVAGAALGLAVASRPTSLLLAAPAVLLVRPRSRTRFVALAVGFAVPVTAAAALNTHLFGSPTSTAYDRIVHFDEGRLEIESHRDDFALDRFPSGAWGQLFDRRRGLLWTSPVTLLSLLGLPWLWRRDRRLAWFVAVGGAGLFIAFSCYALWPTSHAGNRFLMPVVGLAVMPLAALFAGPRRRMGEIVDDGDVEARDGAGDERGHVVVALTTVRRVTAAARMIADEGAGRPPVVAATAADASQYREAGFEVLVAGEHEVEPDVLATGLAGFDVVVVPLGFPRQQLVEVIRSLVELEGVGLSVPLAGQRLRAPVAGWALWWWAAASVPLRWMLAGVRGLDGVGMLALLAGGRPARRQERTTGPVCHVIGGLGTGGAQRQLLEYLRHASSPRDDLRVLALFDDNARFADRMRETGAAVEVVYERLRRSRWRHLLARAVPHTSVALALRRRLAELRPRCVVSWLYVADVVTAAAVGRRPTAPLISWVRNLSSWKTWPEYRRWWLRAADRRAARRATLVLANSDAVARDYERWTGLDAGAVVVMVNGVDMARIREAASPAPDHPFVASTDPLLVTVGRIAREKNLGMLVECCRRLEVSGRSANLVIVGHGELETELRDQVAAAGVGHRVAIVGGTDRPEGWMAAADLFVLASRVEGMPNALLEAQALGVPAVTTVAGGAAEVVEDGITGIVVPMDDEDEMFAVVRRLLDDPETRREMGRRAADRVAERFGIERFAARLDGLTGRGEQGSA